MIDLEDEDDDTYREDYDDKSDDEMIDLTQ